MPLHFARGFAPERGKSVGSDTIMPMPPLDLKQLRSRLGCLAYYHNFSRDIPERIRPIISLLQKGVNFAFTPSMDAIVCGILAELSAPSILGFSGWGSVAGGSRPLHVYSDASVDGFSAALLSRSNRTTPWVPSHTSAVVYSTQRDPGLRSTWKPAALSGPPSAFEATFGAFTLEFSDHKASLKYRQSWGPQRARPVAA